MIRFTLPKYNPERKSTFSIADWQHVCAQAAFAFRQRKLTEAAGWLGNASRNTSPRKSDQDGLDAYLCLLVALLLGERTDCLMVGDMETGYIVVPNATGLRGELNVRCSKTARSPSDWVRVFRLADAV